MKTGTKVLIGAGVLGAGALGYYFWKRAQSLPLLTVASEQPTVSKNTLERLIETLPAPTKAPATVEQQAQTAKLVAMLNESPVQTVKAALTPTEPVQTVSAYLSKAASGQLTMDNGAIYQPSNVYVAPTAINTATLVTSSGMRTKPMLSGFNLLR